MSNSFLFLIPLTPSSHLTEIREELQGKCLESLINQNYKNWKALLIGKHLPSKIVDSRFIHLPIEDVKEVKIQHATEHIIKNKLEFDYIIRLDDDDLISANILELYKKTTADVITDFKHWYIDWNSKKISSDFKPWFPNTCIHKTANALSIFGKLAQTNITQIKKNILLIENNHALFHHFYKGKNIIFTASNSPIYLRVLSQNSITSLNDNSYEEYLTKYGNWNREKPLGFPSLTMPITKQNKTKISLKKYIHTQITQLKFRFLLKNK